MLNYYLLLCTALQLFAIVANAASIQKGLEDSGDSNTFPQALTTANFDEEMKHQLHLVEFFSPYCSHCNRFEPVWKKTWEEFHEEGERLGIRMSQVNCFESGDICSKEKIYRYPSISLYGQSGFLRSYPASYERSTPDLIRFMKEEASEQENFEQAVDKVASISLDTAMMEGYLQGKGQQPIVISFWPPSDAKSFRDFASIKQCTECASYQRIWMKLAYRLQLQDIMSGHFSSMEITQLAQKYDLSNLIEAMDDGGVRKPVIAVILPLEYYNVVLYEDEVASASKLVKFMDRVISNYEQREITEEKVRNMIKEPIEIHDISEKDANGLIYVVIDARSKEIMSGTPGLLEEVIQSLSKYENLYFYHTDNDLMTLLKDNYGVLLQQLQASVQKLDPSIFVNYFTAITSTTYPRIYLFKQGSMVPNVYYGPVDDNLSTNILKWVDENAMPVITEIKGRNYLSLLNYKNEYYEKLVIELVDTGTFDSTKISQEYLNNLLSVMNIFEIIRFEHIYHNINSYAQDESLVDNFKHMVLNGHFKDGHKVLYTYIDLKHYRTMLDRLGLNAERKRLKAGDVLIVDKMKAKYYFTTDSLGESLTAKFTTPLVETLAFLMFPELYNKSIRKVLINSPFGDSLRFLDTIHQHGILGWILPLFVVFFLFQLLKCYRKGRKRSGYVAKRDVVGILGSKNVKD